MIRVLLINFVQAALLVVIAPLVAGIIKKTKARLQMRRGPSFFQPYLDLYKYGQKESVVSEHTSWIFKSAPYIYFAALLVAALLVPVISSVGKLNFSGDIILFIYLLALGRFFLALAGLDAGSAFGGMASSREMAIAAVAEPAALLPLFTLAIATGTTNLTAIVFKNAMSGLVLLKPAYLLSFIALFIVTIAETGRIPVDNPDTHLELTMMHEGMLLEYSGKPLAVLTMGADLKQLLLFTLIANLFFPWGIAIGFGVGQIVVGLVAYLLKVCAIGIIIACIESLFAKMRLFKVPDLLLGSFFLGLLGLIAKFIF
ncbi:MAG: NADH-quinone oxidoreductase subunit H [Peptococcaceae bacterium]|nr:NADH-quinone oxidoreductase subunit H [Peptococcaceae bacterium]